MPASMTTSPYLVRHARATAAAIFCILALASCRDETIQSYTIPKEPEAPMPGAPSLAATDAPSKKPTWNLPSGWIEQPPSAMRIASFTFAGAEGEKADISVVSLGGTGGGDLANVNRWRGQLSLPPIDDDSLSRVETPIPGGGDPFILLDMVSEKTLAKNRFKTRTLAAILKRNERTWFFKMTGADPVVAEEKQRFVDFVKSARFPDEG